MIFATFLLVCLMARPVYRTPVGQFGWNFSILLGKGMAMDDLNVPGSQRGMRE